MEGVSNNFINERWIWDLFNITILLARLCFNPSWKFWLAECDKTTCVSLWLKTKHIWKVEWASFFTELVFFFFFFSYAGTSKDYGGKAPDPSFPKYFSIIKIMLKSRKIPENQQSWIQETNVHRGHRVTHFLLLGVFFLSKSKIITQTPLHGTSKVFCLRENVIIQQ